MPASELGLFMPEFYLIEFPGYLQLSFALSGHMLRPYPRKRGQSIDHAAAHAADRVAA